MTPPELITSSGYALIVVGTFFEGELVMLAAGMAASAGLLSLPLAIIAGMVGIFLSDTVCFMIGRLAGTRLSRWFPRPVRPGRRDLPPGRTARREAVDLLPVLPGGSARSPRLPSA